VVVVSDGAIDDKAVTVQRAEAAANSLKGRSAPISVSLLQMLTSSYAEPDTRAMSCIGSLNTAGKVSITEVHTSASKSSLTSDAAIAGITEVMAATLGTSASETVPIASVSSQQVLHRLPGDAAVAQLSVTVGRSVTILLEPNTDLSQITCAGRALDVTDLGPLRDEYSVGVRILLSMICLHHFSTISDLLCLEFLAIRGVPASRLGRHGRQEGG